MTWTGGFGIVGHGVNTPPRTRKRLRPDLCAEHGHPGCTYNPWHNFTSCLCGAVWYRGNRNQHIHAECCDGPLGEVIEP